MLKKVNKFTLDAHKARNFKPIDQTEIWRSVNAEPFSHRYEVSNFGSVRNKETMQILTPFKSSNGYLIVRLYINNVSKTFKNHKLVASAFLRDSQNRQDLVVNHINGNKTDNRVINLELITFSQNVAHGSKLNRETGRLASKGAKTDLVDVDMVNEIWKPLDFLKFKDFFEKYEVSCFGRVRNNVYHGVRGRKKIVPWHNLAGYPAVTLVNGKKKKTIHVHLLVAYSFLNQVEMTKNLVDHIDSNKWNPALVNLRWVSLSENASFSIGKLSDVILSEIVQLYSSENFTQIQIAKKYNISQQTVSKILRGVSYKEKEISVYTTNLGFKLNSDKVREIRKLYFLRKLTKKEISIKMGVSAIQVGNIILGKSWQHVKNDDGSEFVPEISQKLSPMKGKITLDSAEKIINLYLIEGLTQGQIAKKYGIDTSVVSRIISKRLNK